MATYGYTPDLRRREHGPVLRSLTLGDFLDQPLDTLDPIVERLEKSRQEAEHGWRKLDRELNRLEAEIEGEPSESTGR